MASERRHQTSSSPHPGTFSADTRATASRVAALRRYMTEHVLDGNDFICTSRSRCEASTTESCSFSEGHLSHVGKHLDMVDGRGRPRRVVVVGRQASARGRPRTDMAARYRAIHDESGLNRRMTADRNHQRRNPHLRGTTLALQTVFGLPTAGEHSQEFLDLPGARAHVFDCCAILNRTLCSSHRIGASSGRPTPTMVANCERHFDATLRILEPTIVVQQGADVWSWSSGVLRPLERLSDHLFRCELGEADTLVCTFMHPSSWGATRWDQPSSPYFLQVVAPTLRRAIELL